MQAINLKVTIEEANLVLEGLGNLPFARVFALIAKIQEQAGQQCNGNGRKTEAAEMEVEAVGAEE
jgi:hypothetical protein